MRIHSVTTVHIVLLIGVAVLLTKKCQAAVVHDSKSQLTSRTSSARFVFWETCEDQWNDEKGVTERCCAGNYKCSSDICKDNRLCGLISLWCYNKSCSAKDEQDKREEEKDEDKDSGEDEKEQDEEEGDEPEQSGEEEEEEEEEEEDLEGTDDGTDDKGGDREDASPAASASASPSRSAVPTPTASPSRSPMPTPSASASPSGQAAASSSPSASASPSAAAAAAAAADGLECSGLRERREIRDLSEKQRREWGEAIMGLRSERDANGDSEWDRLVRVHMENGDEAHGGSYFLPWHRLLLLRLENALRRRQADLALPYWDWTLDAEDAALSPVWGAGFAGGARAGNEPIQSGRFQNMAGRYPSGHVVRRNFTSGRPGAIGRLWGADALERLVADAGWAEFSDGVEAAHAAAHVGIGGDMGDAWNAPNDPVFYLLHAHVDSLYAMRQLRRGARDFGGTHDFAGGTQDARATRRLAAFGVPAATAFHVPCVRYVAPRARARGKQQAGARGGARDVCGDDAFRSGRSLTRARCERGRDALRRAPRGEGRGR